MRTTRPILCMLALLLIAISPAWASTAPTQSASLPTMATACPPAPAAATGTAGATALPAWLPAPQPVIACTQICCTSSSQCQAACGQPASCAGSGSCKHCLIF